MSKGEIPMWEKVPIIKGLAETERFELSVQMYPYDGLANRWFQPLTHVSGSQRRRWPIAGGLGWGKGLGVSFFRGLHRSYSQPGPRLVAEPTRPIADGLRDGERSILGRGWRSFLRDLRKRRGDEDSSMMTRWIAQSGKVVMTGAALALGWGGVAGAQIAAIDSDLVKPANAPAPNVGQGASFATPATPASAPPVAPVPAAAPPAAPATFSPPAANDSTYHQDDLIGAAEGVFGKGAKGVASVIQSILKKQGEPNGYIVGREAGGAIAVGLRYGSGTLYHRIEGKRPVYWAGPSLGFDTGGNAGSTFMLVYNLYNTDDLFSRFGSGEGAAYLVGGFNVSYLRRGDVVLIPVRAGVGLRLGVNAGYIKFSKKQNWFPL
jgi:hypothetical protein